MRIRQRRTVRAFLTVTGAAVLLAPAAASAEHQTVQAMVATHALEGTLTTGLAGLKAREMAAPTAAEQAQVLYKEGVAQYKMSNYAVSLEKFSEAFVLSLEIEDEALKYRVSHALQFNLARAHLKTYKLDRDILHLRQAVDLLENYLRDDTGLGVEEEARTLMEEAKAALEQEESGSNTATRSTGAEAARDDEADEDTGADDTVDGAVDGTSGSTPRDEGPRKPGRALSLAGYGSIGMAAAGLGLMAGGIVMGKSADEDHAAAGTKAEVDDADRRGRLGNTLTIAGAATAGVFAVAGVTLVVMGAQASKKRGGTAANMWMAPALGTALTGFQVGGRF